MASWVQREFSKLKFFKHSTKKLLLPSTFNLQNCPHDSSTLSQVKEEVLAADLRCTTCQNRLAHAISTIDVESVVVHVVEKKVTVTRKSGINSSTKVTAVYKNLASC
ncbi:uncharacterized protein LOC126687981 isoform X2 [Mercurialis annua]|uniref:uncharacterized protein LOC126687981 isoform X2 n=1 Tax=Mercurialis annua TaxID=3986 RepID=UPI002160127D|nr:uncharacterized protein LOC126687981 isoform X2 [Mercurialis annua]